MSRVSLSFSTHRNEGGVRCPTVRPVDGQNLPAEDGPGINIHLDVVRLVFDKLCRFHHVESKGEEGCKVIVQTWTQSTAGVAVFL